MSTTEKDILSKEPSADQSNLQQQMTDDEALETARMKLEDKVLRYFQNKEIAKERNEENKLLLEEIEEMFQETDGEEIVIPLPSGDNAVLTPSIREREVLDKDLLAEEMQVPKDELKTPFDFCMFTSQGKLTPAMITKHTSIEREMKLRISKRKRSTKRRKSRSSEGSIDQPSR
ncbi:hypothetical protein [Alicyclobacillus dauci]|uniref:Uncharacterized protein n=1 Tax=Alicyclobacillus dauci TaxID=1475485 RepID=A0ABY6Z632_9BACL|nr:hypothetical protein [Alicyclobacillus dauci]WAH37646.1 hypothetical protein NZD86_03710 [Alicyclobacillus dauci]